MYMRVSYKRNMHPGGTYKWLAGLRVISPLPLLSLLLLPLLLLLLLLPLLLQLLLLHATYCWLAARRGDQGQNPFGVSLATFYNPSYGVQDLRSQWSQAYEHSLFTIAHGCAIRTNVQQGITLVLKQILHRGTPTSPGNSGAIGSVTFLRWLQFFCS